MIAFWLVNLLPPGAPKTFALKTPAGLWTFKQSSAFNADEAEIRNKGACANTYAMEFPLPSDSTRNSMKDAAFDEVLPICLAASFVMGSAVTIGHPHPASEVTFSGVGSHFPRQRGIPHPAACVSTMGEFAGFVERFVDQYRGLNSAERLLLLTHFYIDALSCWSLENLYLSGSTLLQIIASSEENTGGAYAATHAAARTGKPGSKPAFFDYLAGAADRVGIAPPSHDVIKIRNSLIHEGTLKLTNFPTQADAAEPIAEALRWVDDYMYAVLKVGRVPVSRHKARELTFGLNSFSF